MSAPRVSVVMIAYNSPEFIGAAIESILAQDLQDFELIIVDDGSPEDIPGLIAPYGDRVQYFRQENAGPGVARHTGLRAAKGEYVAYADSDDIHLPYRLSAQAAILDAYPEAGQVFCDFSTWVDGEITHPSTLRLRRLGVDESDFDTAIKSAFGGSVSARDLELPAPSELLDSRIYHGRVPALIAGRHIAWDMASMFRRSHLQSIGGHHPTLRYYEDWYLASRMAQRFEIVFWDAPVLHYRQHSSQITAKMGPANAGGYRDVVLSVWMKDTKLAAEHPELLKRMFKRATLGAAYYNNEAKEYRAARKDILRFIRGAPLDRHGYTALARNLARDLVFDRSSSR